MLIMVIFGTRMGKAEKVKKPPKSSRCGQESGIRYEDVSWRGRNKLDPSRSIPENNPTKRHKEESSFDRQEIGRYDRTSLCRTTPTPLDFIALHVHLVYSPDMGRPKRNVFAAAEETSTPPPALTATQSIARVIKAEGKSLYSCSLPDKKTILVELLPRFRNTIWIRRGGYVLVDAKEADTRDNKLDGEIINVVRDEHVWRKEAYWYARSLVLGICC